MVGIVVGVLLLAAPAWAATNHYVRAAATGSANGSDWTNACTDFTGSCAVASLVRGDTYYVATGTYGSRTFNTAASGTLVITIKGATVADHGTDTGWQASYSVSTSDGGSQATFTNPGAGATGVVFTTSYWTFDGSVGSTNTSTSYGFFISKPASCVTGTQENLFVGIATQSATSTGYTIKYVSFLGCGSAFDYAQRGLTVGCAQCYVTASTFSNNFFDGFGQSFALTNVSTSTFEYNWSQNQWSGVTHGETLAITNCHNSDFGGCSTAFTQGQGAMTNTFRYNIIKNCRGTACMAGLGPGNVLAFRDWDIYGNVFVDAQGGNGVISTGGANFVMQNVKMYNNTIIGAASTISWQCEQNPQCASASGNVFKNNVLYSSGSVLNADLGSAYDSDYNAWLSADDTPPTETNSQILTLDPFVNSAIGDTGDYHLTASAATTLTAGLTLASPYTQDLAGNTRGADGKSHRGAYETGGTASTSGWVILIEVVGLIFNAGGLAWIAGRFLYGRTLESCVAVARWRHAHRPVGRHHVLPRTDRQAGRGIVAGRTPPSRLHGS